MTNAEITFNADGNMLVAARTVPVPASLSEAARRFLKTAFPPMKEPALDDPVGWKRAATALDAMFEPMVDRILGGTAASVTSEMLGDAVVHVARPHELSHPDWTHLSIHGGSWVFLGGGYAKAEAATYAAAFGCTTYALDYRMPPDHPFPAALDDALAAYLALAEKGDPRQIIVSGGSAGGNIAAALVLRLRDLELPLPGALVLLTGSLDLTRAGDTFRANDGIDTVLRPYGNASTLYAAGHDLRDPYLSPLFADFKCGGFPPTLLQSGTRDLLLSDTVRMHRKLLQAGHRAELHVWEAMPHGGFGGAITGTPTPEDLEVRAQILDFLERTFNR